MKQTDIFATHTPELLCDHPAAAFPQRVLVLQTHRWLPFVVANPHNQEVRARISACVYVHVREHTLKRARSLALSLAECICMCPGAFT